MQTHVKDANIAAVCTFSTSVEDKIIDKGFASTPTPFFFDARIRKIIINTVNSMGFGQSNKPRKIIKKSTRATGQNTTFYDFAKLVTSFTTLDETFLKHYVLFTYAEFY